MKNIEFEYLGAEKVKFGYLRLVKGKKVLVDSLDEKQLKTMRDNPLFKESFPLTSKDIKEKKETKIIKSKKGGKK